VRFEAAELHEEESVVGDKLHLNFGLLLQGCTYVSRLSLDAVPGAGAVTGGRGTMVLPQCDMAVCVMDSAVEVVVHAREDGTGKFSASFDVLDDGRAVEVRGTILRSGQGTPALRDNVRCIGKRCAAAQTDSSDWAGF